MSRYIRDMELQLPENDVQEIIDSFLENGGFYKGVWKGKPCYISDYGDFGNLKEMYFFDYTYVNGKLHFEAWVKDGKTNEIGLTGAYNFMMKQPYTTQVASLENNLIAKLPMGSEQRIKAESGSKLIKNNNRKMDKGRQVVYFCSIIALAIALLNVMNRLFGFLQ